MNWIILIIAGLFEVGFTFCLGKIKGATGTDFYLWGTGFVISVTLSMLPSGKSYPNIAHRYCISYLDRNRSSRYRIGSGILFFHGIRPTFRTPVLYDNSDSFNHRIETDLNLIIRIQGDTPLSSYS